MFFCKIHNRLQIYFYAGTPLQRGEVDARSVQKTPAGTTKNVRPVHSLSASLLHKLDFV